MARLNGQFEKKKSMNGWGPGGRPWVVGKVSGGLGLAKTVQLINTTTHENCISVEELHHGSTVNLDIVRWPFSALT